MCHAIVKRKVRGTFMALNRSDYEVALCGVAPRFEHVLSGSSPIGRTRHTRPAMGTSFERLFRLNRNRNFNTTLQKRKPELSTTIRTHPGDLP
jgi:hypothetical protein